VERQAIGILDIIVAPPRHCSIHRICTSCELALKLVRSLPDSLRYEHGLILAEDDYVIVQGGFSGNGRPAAFIAADVVRIEDGRLTEYWDVLQDEATQSESKSGLSMFGGRFPA
jgi:hypothetical protein